MFGFTNFGSQLGPKETSFSFLWLGITVLGKICSCSAKVSWVPFFDPQPTASSPMKRFPMISKEEVASGVYLR